MYFLLLDNEYFKIIILSILLTYHLVGLKLSFQMLCPWHMVRWTFYIAIQLACTHTQKYRVAYIWNKKLKLGFQRLVRRDKKNFLSNQCKEIEKNNRMRKTSDLFKKIKDTKEIFHAKMGTIKDRNGMDIIDAEDIQKRWQE